MKYTIPTLVALSQPTGVVCNWTESAKECRLFGPGKGTTSLLGANSPTGLTEQPVHLSNATQDLPVKIKTRRGRRAGRTVKTVPATIFTPSEAGFAQFLKEHSSPRHQRVTAGGRIVPMLRSEIDSRSGQRPQGSRNDQSVNRAPALAINGVIIREAAGDWKPLPVNAVPQMVAMAAIHQTPRPPAVQSVGSVASLEAGTLHNPRGGVQYAGVNAVEHGMHPREPAAQRRDRKLNEQWILNILQGRSLVHDDDKRPVTQQSEIGTSQGFARPIVHRNGSASGKVDNSTITSHAPAQHNAASKEQNDQNFTGMPNGQSSNHGATAPTIQQNGTHEIREVRQSTLQQNRTPVKDIEDAEQSTGEATVRQNGARTARRTATSPLQNGVSFEHIENSEQFTERTVVRQNGRDVHHRLASTTRQPRRTSFTRAEEVSVILQKQLGVSRKNEAPSGQQNDTAVSHGTEASAVSKQEGPSVAEETRTHAVEPHARDARQMDQLSQTQGSSYRLNPMAQPFRIGASTHEVKPVADEAPTPTRVLGSPFTTPRLEDRVPESSWSSPLPIEGRFQLMAINNGAQPWSIPVGEGGPAGEGDLNVFAAVLSEIVSLVERNGHLSVEDYETQLRILFGLVAMPPSDDPLRLRLRRDLHQELTRQQERLSRALENVNRDIALIELEPLGRQNRQLHADLFAKRVYWTVTRGTTVNSIDQLDELIRVLSSQNLAQVERQVHQRTTDAVTEAPNFANPQQTDGANDHVPLDPEMIVACSQFEYETSSSDESAEAHGSQKLLSDRNIRALWDRKVSRGEEVSSERVYEPGKAQAGRSAEMGEPSQASQKSWTTVHRVPLVSNTYVTPPETNHQRTRMARPSNEAVELPILNREASRSIAAAGATVLGHETQRKSSVRELSSQHSTCEREQRQVFQIGQSLVTQTSSHADPNLAYGANPNRFREETRASSLALFRPIARGVNAPLPYARATTATSHVHAFAGGFSADPGSGQR